MKHWYFPEFELKLKLQLSDSYVFRVQDFLPCFIWFSGLQAWTETMPLGSLDVQLVVFIIL
jgi:hypothetical protein